MANAGEVVVKIRGDNSELDRALTQSQRKMQQAGQAMQRIGKSLTTFVTLPILGIGAAAVKSAADLELQQAAFETMLGSATKAKVLLQDLETLAASTPFQMTDLAEGTKTLLAFGTELEDTLPILKQLGDISLGDSQRLKQLALVYGQVQSAGRLMGQDLLQLINVGFNPLQLISEKTGETMAELKKRMEEGAISADEVAAAFKIATSEGGLFFGGMERASTTLAGKFSTLMDNVGILGRSFADILMPALKDIVDWATVLVQKWAALDDGTKKVILIVAGLVAAIGPLVLVAGLLTTKIVALNIAMAANPAIAMAAGITAAVAAAAALTVGLVTLIRRNREYKALLYDTTNQVRQLTEEERRQALERLERARADVQRKLIQEFEELREQQERVRNSSERLGDQQKALAQQQVGLLEQSLIKLRAEMVAIDGAIDEFNESIPESAVELENFQSEIEETVDALTGSGEEDPASLLGALNRTFGPDAKWIKTVKEVAPAVLGETFGPDAKWVKDAKEAAEEVEEFYIETFGPDSKWAKAIKAGFDETFGPDAKWRKEAKAADIDYNDATIALYGALTNSIGTLFDNLGKQRGESEHDAAMRRKAFGIADVLISTAVGIARALPDPVLATFAALTGAAQLAAVASTPIPALAQGGIVTQPTTAIVGEGGQPEIIFPLDQLEDFLGGESGGQHLTINLDSKPIYDGILPATRDRRIMIDARAVV